MSEDTEALRGFVRGMLPDRIVAALAGYERFTSGDPPDDAKSFAAWHAAAKGALAHVEALVKLVRWAEIGADASLDPGGEDGLDHLLAQARAALGAFGTDDCLGDLGGDACGDAAEIGGDGS